MREPLSPGEAVHWLARTDQDTEACGARLALALPPPAPARALQLHLLGDLGAGKTTLARGFIMALGHSGTVRSPTYTLIETYSLASRTVVHTDLYRLADSGEIEGLGLRDLDTPEHVWLIEWPERGLGMLPPPDLTATLTVGSDGHAIDLRASGPAGTRWLAGTLS